MSESLTKVGITALHIILMILISNNVGFVKEIN